MGGWMGWVVGVGGEGVQRLGGRAVVWILFCQCVSEYIFMYYIYMYMCVCKYKYMCVCEMYNG